MMPKFNHAGIVSTTAPADPSALDMVELAEVEGLACAVRSMDGVWSRALVMMSESGVEGGGLRRWMPPFCWPFMAVAGEGLRIKVVAMYVDFLICGHRNKIT